MTVQDVNDNPPAFNSSVYNLTMLEESSIGTFVGLVTATDPDKDPKVSNTYHAFIGSDKRIKRLFVNIFFPWVLTNILGAHHLIETVLLRTHNICFG